MTPERWQQIADAYHAALETPASEREAFLARSCAGDPDLKHEIETLMAQETAVGPLDEPAWVPDNLLVQPEFLAVGSLIGPYRIEGVLGAGGMGQVYRARDAKLNRSVALKVLPDAFASDPERRARFQREAQVLAALNHPHIGAIHGFEDSGVVHALVLELVEGPTLADRLARGRIPLDESIAIALQIVAALEAAHERGIVHRDLKPANVKIKKDGTVKVLDFGLARLVETDGTTAVDATASPTLTSPGRTTAGTILGTAAYMSPEQAKGQSADARSDVWALGCVLYEMLTGVRPFPGSDVADTLAAVLRAEPDWAALPKDAPPHVRHLLERCLRKDRRRRLAAVADVRLDLEDSLVPAVGSRPRGRQIPWVAAVVVAATVCAAGIVLGLLLRPEPPLVESGRVQFTIAPPLNELFGGPVGGGTGDATQVAISPDGKQIAFVAGARGGYRIWLRTVSSGAATILPGTDGARNPFWSPDSQKLGFFAADKLKTVTVAGASVSILCDAPRAAGGSWGRDNVIVFAPFSGTGGLLRVSSTGGRPVNVTSIAAARQFTNHRWPFFLPDGRHFLYTVTTGICCNAAKPATVHIGSLDANEADEELMQAESSVVYGHHHLFFVTDNASPLLARPFDPDTRQFTGDAVPVAESVSYEGSRYIGVSISTNGTLVYGPGGDPALARQLAWFDRSGKVLKELANIASMSMQDGTVLGTSENIALSPDEKRLVVSLRGDTDDDANLHLVDATTGSLSRLTVSPGIERSPVWSPDGQRIAYISDRAGATSLREVSVVGDNDKILADIRDISTVTSWSKDGQYLAFTREGPSGFPDVWALPLFGDHQPFAVAQTRANESSGTFSPDHQWIAFTAATGGQVNVYVTRFPTAGETHTVSTEGGTAPIWREDGKELFYLTRSRTEEGMVMSVQMLSSGPSVPQPVFRTAFDGGRIHAVTRDGQQFLILGRSEAARTLPLTVIVNWTPPNPR